MVLRSLEAQAKIFLNFNMLCLKEQNDSPNSKEKWQFWTHPVKVTSYENNPLILYNKIKTWYVSGIAYMNIKWFY